VANEKRLRANFVAGALDAGLATTATSMSSPGLADLPAVDATNHVALSITTRDSDGRVTAKEIVYVTAHTAAATTATIARGKEGTSDPGTTWAAGTKWVHAPTARDFPRSQSLLKTGAANLTTTSTSLTAVDATNLGYLTFPDCEIGDIILVAFNCNTYNTGNNYNRFDFEVDQPTSANVYVGESFGAANSLRQSFGANTIPMAVLGRFAVTERGTHAVRPVWKVSAGTAHINNGNASEDNGAVFTATVSVESV
jgi:hypothetical protein